MEGGSGGKTKKDAEAANQADKDAELKAVEASKGKRQLIRGKMKCNRCGELRHERVATSADLMGQTSLQKGRLGQILLNMAQMQVPKMSKEPA